MMENTINKVQKNCKTAGYIIIGNSAAGLSAVSSIRSVDKEGSIIVLSNELFKNYSKPLITYYLAGKVQFEDMYFKTDEFYIENNVSLKTETNIIKIDFELKQVISDKGFCFKYNKLLLANGGTPIIPKIKVFNTYDKVKTGNIERIKSKGKKEFPELLEINNYKSIPGIFTFTNFQDAIQVQGYIIKNNIKEAVILGGGLIGLKSAEALLEIGIKVRIIELSDRILSATFDKQASLIIEKELENKGSKIYTANTINKIIIKNDKLNEIELQDGERIESKLLIIAVGVVPDLSILKNSRMQKEKISYSKGIVTDEHMETGIKDVFAAGDVVQSFDFITGNKANFAIWPLAVRQGEIAGSNMAGLNKTYGGSYFMNSIEVLKIPSISMGITNPPEDIQGNIEIIKDFKPEKKMYKKIVILDGKIIGMILEGNIDRAGIYGGLIKNKVDVSEIRENLVKEDFGIIQLPNDYKKHLVTGDGIEV
ncbi:MAG: NAD(P)/FAD-dependent oxidoreductase [Candidatus Humimicrobiaceae bacterium]